MYFRILQGVVQAHLSARCGLANSDSAMQQLENCDLIKGGKIAVEYNNHSFRRDFCPVILS